MNVLYVCSSLKRTGPTSQLFNICHEVQKMGHKVLVVTLSNESSDSLKSKFEQNDIRVISLAISRVKGIFLNKILIKRILNEYKPAVVHTQGLRADSLFADLKVENVQLVATLRNVPWLDYPMTYGKLLGWFMYRKHLAVLKKFNQAVTVSNAVKDAFIESNHTELGRSLKVINNGVDTSYFSPEECKYVDRLQALKKEGKLLFISVGHLSSRKDPETVVKGFLESEYSDIAYLIFLGDGEYLDLLRNKYRDNSNVIFLGRAENVRDFLNESDLFISASLSEGFPNTVLEALSLGVPCIISDIAPHFEFQKYFNGIDAISYFKPKNTKELTCTINSGLFGSADRTLIRERIKLQLSKEIMAKKYSKVYSNEP